MGRFIVHRENTLKPPGGYGQDRWPGHGNTDSVYDSDTQHCLLFSWQRMSLQCWKIMHVTKASFPCKYFSAWACEPVWNAPQLIGYVILFQLITHLQSLERHDYYYFTTVCYLKKIVENAFINCLPGSILLTSLRYMSQIHLLSFKN